MHTSNEKPLLLNVAAVAAAMAVTLVRQKSAHIYRKINDFDDGTELGTELRAIINPELSNRTTTNDIFLAFSLFHDIYIFVT